MSAPLADHRSTVHFKVLGRAEGGLVGADIVATLITNAPRAVIGLATGSSPLPLYESLAERGLDLSEVRWFALDEYVGLAADHDESYAQVIQREVVIPLGLDPKSVSLPEVSNPDLVSAAADYERAIQEAGGVDLQILGIGTNGHLAFNEPGSSLNSRTRVDELAQSTRESNARFFPSIDDVPTHCITQGLGTILDAKRLLLLVHGSEKSDVLFRALRGPVSPECPASVLQLHPDVTVIADPAAASLLI